MKHNSSKNQDIKSKFVSREVVYCVSSLIYELVNSEQYLDDLYPVMSQNDYKEPTTYFLNNEMTKAQGIDFIESMLDFNFTGNFDKATLNGLRGIIRRHLKAGDFDYEDFCEFFDLEPDINEALEHWIVSDFLAEKLEAKGEMILDDFLGLTIWGRICSGQSILLDGVISEICEDMEILDGQAYSWADK